MTFLRPLYKYIGFVLLFVLPFAGFAGTTGKISGRITDASTGDPLSLVNVVVDGTTRGAATDLDGYYFIINLAPGTYTLKVSALGYTSQSITDVKVTIDKTTIVDAELSAEVIKGETVTVTAKRPIVEPDRTFSTSTVNDEDLKVMPVNRVQEVVEIQAGVVDGHFRGGRSGEVSYMVDGVPVQDVYDNSQGTGVDQGAVKELQVITGTFNAEYGQAMSGVVNLVTKEGDREKYAGQYKVQFGDYVSNHKDIFAHIDNIDPLAITSNEFYLSGPVPLTKRFSFFASGRLESNDGWLYGQNRWGLEWPVYVASGTITGVVPTYGDGKWVPMNDEKVTYLYGKLTYRATDNIKLNYSSLWEDRDYHDYAHDWMYIPEGNLNRFRRSRTNILRLTYGISQNMFFEAASSNSFTEYYHYLYKDPYDTRYVNPLYQDINPGITLKIAGNMMEHFRRFTNTNNFQSRLSWQINPVHYVVGGFSFNFNDISYDQFNIIQDQNYIQPDTNGNPVPLIFVPVVQEKEGLNHDTYLHHPFEASAYLQDKIEQQNFIVNVGLRFDYFNPDGQVLSDPQDPNVYNPLLESRASQTLEERLSYWYKKATPKAQVSPRIGIGYPISETGVLHFAYGHFFQRPRYEYLYTNPEFEIEPGQTINTLMGNADLEAEKTISYEFGLQQGLTEDIAVSMSIFQRDIHNLVSSDQIVDTYDAGTKYMKYINRDFAEVRGVILSLDKRYSHNLSGSIDYTYQIAEGNASDPQDAFNAAKGNNQPVKVLLPLDWDRRHTVNINVNYSVPNNWGLSFITTYGSGLPYTVETRGMAIAPKIQFENDGRKPSYFNVDMSAFKQIPIFGRNSRYKLTAELMVRNLFDIKNENGVFGDTGRATYTRDEELNKHIEIPYINTLEEVYNHPEYYSRPREVRASLIFNF